MKEDDRLFVVENSLEEVYTTYFVEEILVRERTPYQMVEIFRLKGFGKSLFLDGVIQSSEYDEYIYHESLVHPAMFVHPSPEDIFIGGGAEGATLREVLKHPEIKHVKMVELDERECELCKQYLPEFSSGAFNDTRVELKFDDARIILDEDNRYDIIIMDLLDPADDNPSEGLYTPQFFKKIKKKLKKGGVFVTQAGSVYLSQGRHFKEVLKSIMDVFSNVVGYTVNVPSFQVPWGIIMASETQDLYTVKKTDIEGLRYYSIDFHPHLLGSFIPLKNELGL